MKNVPSDGLQSQLNGVVARLFRGQGVESVLHGDWVIFPDHGLSANAQVVSEVENRKAIILQVDFRLRIDDGRTLVESAAGYGNDLDSALKQALNTIVNGSFQVLLAAFFGTEAGEHADRSLRTIGGLPRRVTNGGVLVTGKFPESSPGQLDLGWYPRFESRIDAKPLTPGTHWIRFYYARMNRKMVEREVLLDNETWAEFEDELDRLDWPDSDAFYSVRGFQVIQDAPEDP